MIKIKTVQESEEENKINEILSIPLNELNKNKSKYKFLYSVYMPQLREEIELGRFRVKLYFEDYG